MNASGILGPRLQLRLEFGQIPPRQAILSEVVNGRHHMIDLFLQQASEISLLLDIIFDLIRKDIVEHRDEVIFR